MLRTVRSYTSLIGIKFPVVKNVSYVGFSTVVSNTESSTTATPPHQQSGQAVFPQSVTKLLADTGICSRAEAEKFIRQGRVKINDIVCPSPSFKMVMSPSVSFELDGVKLKKKYLIDRPVRLWAMKKKEAELMSEKDADKGRELVIDRFTKMISPTDIQQNPKGFRPLYRLEYTTEGLCFYTNSGEFAKMMDSAADQFGKHYRLRVHGLINDSKLAGLRTGLFVDGIKYKGMDVSIETKAGTITWVNVTCYENKNQAVKKSFEKLFLKVTRAICTGFGPYRMDDILPVGTMVHCREVKLTPEMNAMYLKMLNNRKGTLFKTTVAKDLTANSSGSKVGKRKAKEDREFNLAF